MPYFQQKHDVRHKDDKSPVTDADMAAHHHILEKLAELFPYVPVVSEEDEEDTTPKIDGKEAFFLVDPLDGTRSFVRGEDEFTVNIGLIEKNAPVFGVVIAPARGVSYWGGNELPPMKRKSGEQTAMPIEVRQRDQEITLTRSRSSPSTATQEFLDSLSIGEIIPASSSIKFCWVAEGSADVYPRFGRTMEWDTAAGHAILNAAGGRVVRTDGSPFLYGKPNFENPGFIAYGART